MKFMLLIYGNEDAISQPDREQCYQDSLDLTYELRHTGHYLAASPLQHSSQTASVMIRDGKTHVTDGPFAETHEQLGGFFLVDAKDREEAIAIAARIPGVKWGAVEVRPIIELPGLPET